MEGSSQRLDHLVHRVITEVSVQGGTAKGRQRRSTTALSWKAAVRSWGTHGLGRALQPEARLEAGFCVHQLCVCVAVSGKAFWLQWHGRLWSLNSGPGGLNPGIYDPMQPGWIPEDEALDSKGQRGGEGKMAGGVRLAGSLKLEGVPSGWFSLLLLLVG